MPNHLKVNPFSPGKPINDPELFAGRRDEVLRLIDALFQVGNGNAPHVLITGPRGVGKSSLANLVNKVSTNPHDILQKLSVQADDFDFQFVVATYRAMEGDTIVGVVARLLQELQTALEPLMGSIAGFLKRWKITFDLGVVYVEQQTFSQSEINSFSRDFVQAISTLAKKLPSNYSGIILIIDELDIIVETNANLASFLKVVTESLSADNINNVSFFIVGIKNVMSKLTTQHPSISRVFRTIELQPMTDYEAAQVIHRTLRSAKQKTGNIDIDEEVVKRIVGLAVGYPYPIHLLGYEAFATDTDSVIDIKDFEIALDKVVNKVKREELNQKFTEAGSGDYRKILLFMGKRYTEILALREIAKSIDREPNECSSYMTRLVDQDYVDRIDRGQYRLADPLLGVFISKFDLLSSE